MLPLKFDVEKRKKWKILCLGAHSDDIEIGCGGTILRLLGSFKNTEITWAVFSAAGQRAKEAQKSANYFLKEAKTKHVVLSEFRDGFFPYVGAEIKERFEDLKAMFQPDLILTHYREDLHQDHRLISELTYNTFRNHTILEYEVIKYDGDLGRPNFFVRLDKETCNRKIQLLLRSFRSQLQKSWFDKNAFLSVLRLRGVECKAPENYAEAFYCHKVVF